ncbi:MAG: hypothetical protein C4555_00855 [Dehalococcoidia bacterium]|jgi:hypothetical protein|nr:MAG: hypothetical protein C4555_00855 [Dehalococcoidia bacterium]
MPSTFKALASITVWVLFIFGLLSLVGGFGRIAAGSPSTFLMSAYFGFGVASLFLSVVTMKLRKMLD